MAIVLKYGAPGPIIAAGYAAGVGHQMHEQQDDALKVWQQQNQQQFQAGQSWLDRLQQSNLQQGYFNQQNQQSSASRAFQAEQQQNLMGFQSTQAGRSRDFQAAQTDKTLDFRSGESALDATRRVAEQQRHEQFLREQNTEMGLRRGELTLPPAAQAQLQKLEADKIEAMKLDPAKQAEFMGKYTEQKRGLYGMAQPSNQVPYDERLKNSLGANYEQYKNLPWQFNEQGERSLPAGFKMPGDDEAKQAAASQKQITKYYDANRKMMDDNGKPKFSTPEDAMTAAMTEHATVQGMLRGEKPAPTPEPPADPRNIASYNQMQGMLSRGMGSWTSGGDVPPGKVRHSPHDSYADKARLGSAYGLSAPKVPVPGSTGTRGDEIYVPPGNSLPGDEINVAGSDSRRRNAPATEAQQRAQPQVAGQSAPPAPAPAAPQPAPQVQRPVVAGVSPPPPSAPVVQPQAKRPQYPPLPTQAAPQATRPATQFDIGNLPSNMQQIPNNQRQTFVENMPQHLNELLPDLRKKYSDSWPRPATPEAASKLAPGTVFITPEGRIKTVPF